MALQDMPASVGYTTAAIGSALVLAPGLATRQLGLKGQERSMRLLGAADLILVQGLLRGEPRWPWMVARAALNVAQAAYCFGVSGGTREVRWTGVALLGLTVVDGATAVALSRRTPAD